MHFHYLTIHIDIQMCVEKEYETKVKTKIKRNEKNTHLD